MAAMEAVPAPRVIYRRPWTFTALPSVRRGRGAVVMILGLAAVVAAGAKVLPPREGAFLGLLLLLPAALFLLRAFERPLVVLGRATMVVDAGGPGSYEDERDPAQALATSPQVRAAGLPPPSGAGAGSRTIRREAVTDYSADESLIAVAAEGIGTVEIDVRHVTEADRRAIVDWLEAAVR